MFLVNPLKAKLYQYNRNINDVYDDEDIEEVPLKLCPYNADTKQKFSEDTVVKAKGYYIVKRDTDIREGDQIEFRGKRFTVLEVIDNWIFNRIENIIIAIGSR